MIDKNIIKASKYLYFDRKRWAQLSNNSLHINQDKLNKIQGSNKNLSLTEIAEIYQPLSDLLDLKVNSKLNHYQNLTNFFQTPIKKPFIIGITGSVAVGKSTTARLVQHIIQNWDNKPKVELVTTDCFLYPNQILNDRNIMHKKGFPVSYNEDKLLQFLIDINKNKQVEIPIYSHLVYDILPTETKTITQPDILIIEGLNILQNQENSTINHSIKDFLDFSIYVDAEQKSLKKWYLERFLSFRSSAFADEKSYFHRYAQLEEQVAIDIASNIWHTINEVNLIENIIPTRESANLILEKDINHQIQNIKLTIR